MEKDGVPDPVSEFRITGHLRVDGVYDPAVPEHRYLAATLGDNNTD
jgi:hypothetical protein